MSTPGSNGPLEIVVEPRNDEYDRDDTRWRDQVAGLYTDLYAEAGAGQRGRPVDGTKGTVDQLVIALGTAGVFGAAVDCIRAWLQRDRSRRLDVRWDEGGVERHVTLTGDALDTETVREIAKAAANRLGGPAWPAGTGPS